jgi:hypothetical protein
MLKTSGQMPVEAFASAASAWIAWHRRAKRNPWGGAAAGNRHCEEPTGPARSGRPNDKLRDEAIQVGTLDWIASLTLAMTIRFRDAPEHSNHAK